MSIDRLYFISLMIRGGEGEEEGGRRRRRRRTIFVPGFQMTMGDLNRSPIAIKPLSNTNGVLD